MSRCKRWIVAVCLGFPSLGVEAQLPGEKDLFRSVQLPSRVAEDAAMTRWRNVTLERSALERAEPLRLNLFEDTSVIATYRATESAYGGGWLVAYDLDGDPFGSAFFSVKGDSVTATIRTESSLYKLSPVGNGEHTLYQVDEFARPRCGSEHGLTLGGSGSGGAGTRSDSSENTIDVMVIFTPAAAAANGGLDGMISLINLATYETNFGYSQSDVKQRLNVVHIQKVAYTENGSELDYVNELQNPADGKMDVVHSLRDDYGADIVALIYDSGSYCGRAYDILCSFDPAFESSAFCVVRDDCATGYYAFAHELGHLMGAQHARTDPINTCGLTPYCYGYKTPSLQYRTIMAYDPGTMLPFWSNPDKLAPNGEALGVAGSEENWRTLNQSASTVAAWRSAKDSGHNLTTAFDSDSEFAGNMFDLDPATDLQITGMDVNVTNLATTAVVRVWYRLGSYVGHEDSSVGWMLLGSDNGFSLGKDLPTHIDLNPSTLLHGGQTYGIYVELVSYPLQSIRYTSGAPTNYQDSYLRLTTGVGKGPGFSGGTESDRRWNGTIHYQGADGAGALTTTFAGGSQFAGNMFDVLPHKDLTINGFDVNIDAGSAPGTATVDVWYRLGSYVGEESDSSSWTYLGTDNRAEIKGAGVPTRIAVGSLDLEGNHRYAFYVHLASYTLGHRLEYTNGSDTFENDDLQLTSGVGKGRDAFTGLTIPDRIWNGTIHYTPAPWIDLGYFLGGPSGVPSLTGTGSLLPNSGLTLTLDNAPPKIMALLVIGLDTWYVPFGGGTLVPAFDFNLTFVADISGSVFIKDVWPAGLQGISVYLQFWMPEKGNPYGWVASNALQATGQ